MTNNAFKNYFSNMMNLQPFDFNTFKHIASQNMEALTSANQVAMEGMQAMWRRHAETLQHQVQKNVDYLKNCATCSSPEEWNKARSEYLAHTVDHLNHYNREVFDMSFKAAAECLDICQKRASETMHAALDASCCGFPNSKQK